MMPTVATTPAVRANIGNRPRLSLPTQVARELRARTREGEWDDSGWLPTEAVLCAEFNVSRATVRQAIKLLESQGLVETRQGVGTRITKADGMVHAGLQELQSITETIREVGRTPSMEYRVKVIRPATPSEQSDFNIASNATVLQLKRLIRADGEVVVFLDDILPMWAMGDGFREADLNGSVFSYVNENQSIRPKRAVAEVHPRRELPADWKHDPAVAEIEDDTMFLLLDQLQYDDHNRPFMRTHAHFVDGRFSFVVLRLA